MNLTPVTINVPTELVLEFQDAAHEVLARLRKGLPAMPTQSPKIQPETPASFVALSASQARPLDVHSLPAWGSEANDAERAAWIIEDLHSDQIGIVASMARHAGEHIKGDTIADESVYDGPRSVAPAMRGLAQRCRRVYREPFWVFHRETTSGQGTYEMPEHVAALFTAALDQAQPGWQDAV